MSLHGTSAKPLSGASTYFSAGAAASATDADSDAVDVTRC